MTADSRSMAPTADPAAVPGLPESDLSAEHLARLPVAVAPAAWECRARALIWLQRARTPRFDWSGAPLPLALVGFVEYLDTPVGAYHEVLAGAVLRVGARPVIQVPFIAVDSLPSVLGGRVNWALPKTMATFEADLAAARARAEGDGWSASVEPVRDSGRRPVLPVRLRFSSTGPLGEYSTSLRARGRPIRVRTRLTGESLGGWLGAGPHLAFALTGRMTIAAPS